MLAKRRSLINSDEKRKALQNVALARGRLKGALKTANQSSDDNSSFDDSEEESQVKRKRIDAPAINQSCPLTLFNRCIDVARFRENAPLYPLCRAWVKNNPREKVEEATMSEPRRRIKREHNPDIVNQFVSGELLEITEMPRPESTQLEPFLSVKPEPVGDFDIDKSSKSKEELIEEHREQWKKIRESCIAHRKKYNEVRYGTSFKLLEALKK
ncbi:protein lin-37 homolog [Anopheles merus]|uniref:Uncharacterized protein n=1 Tax=Anopheles merus TaxID=30066 RepID=A0A182V180_ANOME|nr:protein lin-37 homolog [Anopheles merus]